MSMEQFLLICSVLLLLRYVLLLRKRLKVLEKAFAKLRAEVVAQPVDVSAHRPILDIPIARASVQAAAYTAEPVPSVSVVAQPITAPNLANPATADTMSIATPDKPSAVQTALLHGIDRSVAKIKQWFFTGNVPVKVGALVLLAGVAALLKYASDQGWLFVPIALRLAAVSVTALFALGFAWRKRASHRSFALPVQGLAIGVLLLVVFAALKRYGLIPMAAAFWLSAVLIAALALMAVLQNAHVLALLGVFAGFISPLWLSAGSGNPLVLFVWYACLNAGIFAMAWLKPWRSLNLLGFGFTWGIATLWGVLQYHPAIFWTAQSFLTLFFGLYLLLPLAYARQRVTHASARMDGVLLFATPFIAFSLQAGLVQGNRLLLAWIALGLGAVYTALAWGLHQQTGLRRLTQAYAILALAFVTLAIPLALSAQTTAVIFALEGAGLVWLGLTQQQRWIQWTGLALQVAAACAFFYAPVAAFFAWTDVALLYRVHDVAPALRHAQFVSALLIALAGWCIACLYRQVEKLGLALTAYLWGLVWCLGALHHEIYTFVPAIHRLHSFLLIYGFVGWLAAQAYRQQAVRALALTTLFSMFVAAILAGMQAFQYGDPLARHGVWMWSCFAVLGLHSLRSMRADTGQIAGASAWLWWQLWPVVLSLSAGYWRHQWALAQGWAHMLLALPWLLLAVLVMQRWTWLRWPLGQAFDRWQIPLGASTYIALGLWWLMGLNSTGASAPLPWVVLLNPLDLTQIAVLLLLALWLGGQVPQHVAVWRKGLLLAGGLLLSVMTLRCVHYWGGVPWDTRLLGNSLAQASLTLLWSVIGMVAWVMGSRRGQWHLWLSGAVLMAVVLTKLLLIDRNNLGNVWGISAFLVYGLLCTLLGWLAPAPARRTTVLSQEVTT